MAILLAQRRRFQIPGQCGLQFQLGAIALPNVFRELVVTVLITCMWAVGELQRKNIRKTLDQHKMRSVWFTNSHFGRQNHRYSHLASVLPRVLREKVDYNQQKSYGANFKHPDLEIG